MSLNFNFNDISGVVKSRRLQPWGIYDVKFSGARVDELQGKKDPTQTYKVIRVRFEDKDQNYYEEGIFFPKDGDDERREYTNASGETSLMPSIHDMRMGLIGQIARVLNPEGYKKMQEASAKFKSFDDVAKAFVAITDKAKGAVTKIKLVGRNNNGRIEPVSPRVVAVSKEGEIFTSDSFIGDNVAFSAYELRRKDALQNAAPTPVSSFTSSQNSTNDDFDFDNLLN